MTYISSKVVKEAEGDFHGHGSEYTANKDCIQKIEPYVLKVINSPIVIIDDIEEAKDGNVSLIDIRGKHKDIGIVVWDLKGNRFYFEWYFTERSRKYGYSDATEVWWDDVNERNRTLNEAIQEFRSNVGSLYLNSCEVYLNERELRFYRKK